MATNNTPNEEVDLGKLFQVIGNGFSKLFKAISNLFKSIFHYFILLLIFFKKHAIILGIATLVGGILGFVLDKKKEPVYQSSMILETNFGVGHRLYNQIDYLSNLISNEDSTTLANVFDITSNEAAKLRDFKIEPYDKEKNLPLEYDYYMQHTDTIFTRNFTMEDFKIRMDDPDFRFQILKVKSLDAPLNKKLKNGLLKLAENEHSLKEFKLKKEEFLLKNKIIEKDLKAIDSLRVLYKEVAILNAQNKKVSATSIDLSGKQNKNNPDIELFKERRNLIYRVKDLNKQKTHFNFIINIVSDFNIGEEVKGITTSLWFKYALYGFILSLLTILGYKVNTFLNKYQK